MADQMIPTPWVVVPGGERFRGVAEDVLIVGNRHFAHEGDDDCDEGPPCTCECDGDNVHWCSCRESCGWVSTTVALVLGNPTAGGIPTATAAEIVRRVNAFPALLSDHADAIGFLEGYAESLTHDGFAQHAEQADNLIARMKATQAAATTTRTVP